ncbi:MAG: DUF1285 domain-containing protein [Pseudomonadales bacterium]|nr:DUF1285 domain-containing protein [Pseudomonadales bacterium]
MTEQAPYSLLAELEKVKDKGKPPIHLWNPDRVIDIDMVIKTDGTWHYKDSPITRQRLVRLFSTVLRKEEDGHFYLVTPVEKCRIQVEDAPFQAVLVDVKGEGQAQELHFTTNVADVVVAGDDHPLRFEIDRETDEPSPYVMVRDGLEALLARNVYYQLVDHLAVKELDGDRWLGVWSRNTFFPIMREQDVT